MEPERVSEEDVERLRNVQGLRLGPVSDLVRLHQSRAAQYARTDENWLSLAATTSFEFEPRAQGSSQQVQTGQAHETRQAALTNAPSPTMGTMHSLSGPIPRTMRSGHRRTCAISARNSAPISRSMGKFVRRTPQLYFPDRAEPEHDPGTEPLPGFGMSWGECFLPDAFSPHGTEETEGVSTQGQQQHQEQGQQEQPSQFLSAEVSELTADFQRISTSSGPQDEDKNGPMGSLDKMDIQ